MWTSGYLFDVSKTKKIYTFVVQEKYPNKNDFLLLWENKCYNVQVWSSGQLRSKEFEKKTLILAFEEKLWGFPSLHFYGFFHAVHKNLSR